MQEKKTDKKDISGYGPTIAAKTAAVFVVVAFLLIAVDFVPQTPSTLADAPVFQEGGEAEKKAAKALADESPAPARVIIPSIGVDVLVKNPGTTDVAALDAALLEGAVHYPGSGTLTEERNMLIFGHSSYLPVVRNKAFKAFNELGKLQEGDAVIVRSRTHEYSYRVMRVRLTTADAALVRFDTGRHMLTLSTCNTFGEKSERYVVEAELVKKSPIEAQK